MRVFTALSRKSIQKGTINVGKHSGLIRLLNVQNTTGIVCSQARFALYRIGFCSVSKVALVQCEQELTFICGVPQRSQGERKPYPLHNLQCSLLV